MTTDEVSLKLYETEVAKGAVSTERFATIMNNASASAQEYAVTTKGATGSTQAFVTKQQETISTLQKTKKASLSAAIGVKALNVALNIGAMAAFSLAIKAVAWAIDTAIVTLKEQKEKVDECSSAYESAKTELSSVTAELESQTKAMDDLLAKDKLTYTEQGQLEELQEITKELQIQKDLAEKQEVQSQKGLAVESAKLVNKQYGKETATKSKIDEYESGADFSGNNSILISDVNNLSSMLAGYRQFNELLDKAYSSKNEDNIEYFKDSTDNLSESIWSTVSSLQEQQINMQDYYDTIKDTPYAQLTSEQKEIVDAYQKTADEIKLVYSELDQNAWNEMEVSNIFNANGIEKTKDELIEMAKIGELTPETIESYSNLNDAIKDSEIYLKNGQTAAEAFCDEINALATKADAQSSTLNQSPTLSISSTIDQLNTQLKPAFDSLKSAYQDIFTDDGFTLENVDLDMLSNVQSVMDEMREAGLGIDTSGFENLAKVLSNSSSTAEEVQNSFNSLANSILDSSYVTDGLNSKTAQLVISMLDQMGVANAEEVVLDSLNTKTETLALQKQFAAQTGYELASATADTVMAFLNEAGASEVTRQALFQLITTEQVFNNQTLDASSKIASLKELATAYGQTAVAARISNLEKANENGHIPIDYNKEIASLQSEINNGINNVKINFDGVGKAGAKSASKAGKETADKYLDAYKKELSELDHINNMGIISEQEYLNRLNALNEKYFNDSAEHQKKYLDEYQSNQEKVYKGLQGLYKELLNEQKDGYDSALSAINKLFDGEIDKLNELKDTSKDSYQSQIDDIDKKIKRLEDERKFRKKSIQDQIDAIKEENEELDRQKALEEALYEARRAENQKSRVYKNGQVEYDTDSKAISKAEDTVDKAKDDIKIAELEKQLDSLDDYYDNLISNLETQQDALKEKMDAVTASYEQQIKQLEVNQQKYADIATAQEDSENKMMATALLGSNWQQLILSGRLDVLDAFKGSYIGICDEISNADTTFGLDASTAAEGYAQSVSDMLAKTTSLETLLQSWKDLNTGLSGVIGIGGSSSAGNMSTTGQSTSNKTDNKGGASSTNGTSGADTITGAVQGGGEQIADTLANQWVPAWQDVGNNMNTICGDIVSCVNEMASATVLACQQAIAAINMANTAKNTGSTSNPTPGSFNGTIYQGKAYAKGTDNAKKGINLIGEDEYELYEDNKGNVSLATEPTLIKMQGGEKVVNHEDTKKVLSGAGTNSHGVNQEALKKLFESCGIPDENGIIKLKPLEAPVLSEQMKNIASLYNPSAMIMESFMPKLPDYSNIATARSQEVNIRQDINVTIPNLDGESAFHKFERGLDQMKLDALQRSYRK